MQTQRTLVAAAIAGVFLLDPWVGVARAQVPAGAAFERLDVNEDGVLSGLELKSAAGRDVNGDGRVTRAEFEGASSISTGPTAGDAADDERTFTERDITEDGFLSGKEVKGFESLDADKDGEVTKDEFLRGRAALRNTPPDSGPPDAARRAAAAAQEAADAAREALAAAAKKRAEALFAVLDANEDGRLSGTEIDPTTAKLDADGDGRITKAEYTGTETPKPTKPGEEAVTALTKLIEVFRTGDVGPFVAVMHDELRRDVDVAVLRWVMDAFRAGYGEVGAMEKLSTTERPIEGKPSHEITADVAFSKGTDKGTLSVTTLEGLVIGFRIRAPLADRINEVLYARLTTDRTLAGEVGEHFADRGREFFELLFAGKDEEAYARLHSNFREELTLDAVKKFFAEFRSRAGAVKKVEYAAIICKTGADGKPASRFSLEYDVDAENGKFQAQVHIQFVGFQGGMIGIHFEKTDE